MTIRSITAPMLTRSERLLLGARKEREGEAGRGASAAQRWLPVAIMLCAIAVIYRGWFASGAIVWADWRFQPTARLLDYWPIPTMWDGDAGAGYANVFDGPLLPVLWAEALLIHLGLDPTISMRVIWVFGPLVIGAVSAYALAVEFFSSRVGGIICALFFVSNTYAVLILTGGQFTVGTGYLLMPTVLLLFYRALRRPSLSRMVLPALCVSVQIFYDLRSTYITLGVLALFSLFYVLGSRTLSQALRIVGTLILQFVVMGVVTGLVHSYWILPLRYAQGGTVSLPTGDNGLFWVHLLSYMQLSHAFALFHPFAYQRSVSPHPVTVDPVFLFLPLPVFAVFLRRRTTYISLFLFALALVSIFFTKGSNEPAGGVYDWMFSHFTGFNMFRDASKFYQPLALAYALLLGSAVAYTRLPALSDLKKADRMGVILRSLVLVGCVMVILAQAMPAAGNTSWGTLAPQNMPGDLAAVNRYIDQQPQFFRDVWYPTLSLGTFSQLHPALGLDEMGNYPSSRLPNPADRTSWIHMPQATAMLRALSVKYIIVADDPANTPEGFRTNKSYALWVIRHAFPNLPETRIGRIHLFENSLIMPKIYISSDVTAAEVLPVLKEAMPAGDATIRDVGSIGDHIAICASCLSIVSSNPTLTRQEVIVRHATHPFLLTINQGYDVHWAAYIEPTAAAQPFWWTWTHPAVAPHYHLRLNGFSNSWWITKPGTYRIVIEYWPQRLTDVGWIISWLTVALCLLLAALPLARRYWRPRAVRIGVEQRSEAYLAPEEGDAVAAQSALG